MYRILGVLALLAVAASHAQSPVDFGRAEFLAALEAKSIDPARYRIVTEHSMVLPQDGFSIQGYLIRGGNLRGIMYGYLDAADQIRSTGRLGYVKAVPAIPVRGIRWTESLPSDLPSFFASLARARFNRFVVAQASCSPEDLRRTVEVAAAHGIDVGISVGTDSELTPYLSATPLLKFIEVAPTEEHLKQIAEAGRLLTIDLDAQSLTGPQLESALATHLPVQVIASPGGTGFFLKQPEVADRTRAWQVIWRVRSPLPVAPESIRALLPSLTREDTQGFELEFTTAPAPDVLSLWGRLAYDPEGRKSTIASPTKKGSPTKR